MNMKKTLFLLILALFLSLGVPAWAEEGIEVVIEDGASVVAVDVGVYAPPGFFGKADFVLPASLVTAKPSARPRATPKQTASPSPNSAAERTITSPGPSHRSFCPSSR